MDFISNKEPQIREMLKMIGIESIDELFIDIPQHLRLKAPSKNDGISEFEGLQLMESLANKNTFSRYDHYLGGGAYEHHIPAIVGAICSKSEFLTAYTPYQPEASQGMLQIIFEFQSAICALTGMDVANASLYDGASACAEAILMSLRINKDRNKIVVAQSLNPHYLKVIEQYVVNHGTEIVVVPFLEDGTLDQNSFQEAIDNQTAAVLLQYPNFLGVVEDVTPFFKKAKEVGALTILCADVLTYGLYKEARSLEADVAVGDGQSFGLPLNYGGPYVGYIACRQELVRQLPGRIVGETVDTQGRRGFVLTLQAREQHIRREKATSNICTNQALAALACLIGILWYGKEGLPKLALMNYQKTAYLKKHLEQIPGIKSLTGATHFNEFVIRFKMPLETVFSHFRKHGIEPGIDLSKYFLERDQCLLVAVTETKSQQQLERYVNVARKLNE